MTVLIAWGSLSVGIVMGAVWRSLCEKQSSHDTNLYDGSANMLEQVEYERFHGDPQRPLQHALLDLLDMCRAIGLPLEKLLPEHVLQWYSYGEHQARR